MKPSDEMVERVAREEIAVEIAAVDEAIAELLHHPISDPVVCAWLPLSVVSQPVSLRALRHYRNRLVGPTE